MFTDIHCHILYGTDDGPSTKEEMLAMLEHSYNDGVRVICATPHFNFSFYGDNVEKADAAFAQLSAAAKQKYPDMRICRGNEIFYHDACIEYIKDGACRPLNGTKYILVDFSSFESKFAIISAFKKLISCGLIPILAHAERYRAFGFSVQTAAMLKDMGALIQVNAASLIGKNGIRQKRLASHMISRGLCDIVASDFHDLQDRTSYMKEASRYIEKKFGKHTARSLMTDIPNKILASLTDSTH